MRGKDLAIAALATLSLGWTILIASLFLGDGHRQTAQAFGLLAGLSAATLAALSARPDPDPAGD
jgi:hypothetical protein